MKILNRTLAALIAIFGIIGFTACGGNNGDDDDDDNPITRTFTVTLENDVEVTINDTRTGTNDEALDTLGIIARLETTLNANKVDVPTGLVVDVEVTTEYTRFYPYSKTKMGANFSFVSADDVEMIGRMQNVLYAMKEME